MIDGEGTKGAGIVFHMDAQRRAWIMTADHVVRRSDGEGRSNLTARFFGTVDDVPATLRKERNELNDLGVLTATPPAGITFPFTQLAEMNSVTEGMLAWAVGYGGERRWAQTFRGGPVSNVDADSLSVDDPTIRAGYSGGPLLAEGGLVMGMIQTTDGVTAKALRIDRALSLLRQNEKLTVSLTVAGSPPKPARRVEAPPRPQFMTDKAGLRYVWIPPGRFRMGCSENPKDGDCQTDESPPHDVTISQGFWMGETEVTIGAYEKYRAAAPGSSIRKLDEKDKLGRKLNTASLDLQTPAVGIEWQEALNYCEWAGGKGLRLPREAEWEYAARAGTKGRHYASPLSAIAWFGDNSGKPIDSAKLWTEVGRDNDKYNTRLLANGNGVHRVGTRTVSPWGLYDMLGNVWEWTMDRYDAKYYETSPDRDPQGPESGESRVLRGGSWYSYSTLVRVSFRGRCGPADRVVNFGFRCAGEFR